jgi:hypothetical protein
MEYTYRTRDIPPDTGVQWQIVDAASNTVLATSPQLSSDALKRETIAFSVGRDASLLRLSLTYRRALGTPRISGTLVVQSTDIKLHP